MFGGKAWVLIHRVAPKLIEEASTFIFLLILCFHRPSRRRRTGQEPKRSQDFQRPTTTTMKGFFAVVVSLLASSSFLLQHTHAFGIADVSSHLHLPATMADSFEAVRFQLQSQSSYLNLLDSYNQALQTDPLKTQVATGAAIAVVADWMAQKTKSDEYDVKRAVSFATFDGCYRVLQHFAYPPMIALCNGQFLGQWMDMNTASALEQSLASQLLIIPLIYYPVFFAITGWVQGLTAQETVQRAQATALPLMLRNWAYWIPVQYGVFHLVQDEAAQIPILIVFGLVWNIILSVLAGAVKPEPVIQEYQPVADSGAGAATTTLKPQQVDT